MEKQKNVCDIDSKRLIQYGNLARKTIRKLLGEKLRKRVDSEDLTNDFWVSILRRLDQFPSFDNSRVEKTYFMQIAKRQVSKQCKKHIQASIRTINLEVQIGNEELVSATPDPQQVSIIEEQLHSLQKVLSPKDRDILNLVLSGVSNRELANKLNIDEGSVRRSRRRILRTAARMEVFKP